MNWLELESHASLYNHCSVVSKDGKSKLFAESMRDMGIKPGTFVQIGSKQYSWNKIDRYIITVKDIPDENLA
jgi:hypothetical protein